MTDTDHLEPATKHNRHVRAFAKANRLRTVTLADGEVVLPLGTRKRAGSPVNQLGTHAWFAGRGTWRVFFLTPKPGAYTRILRGAGCGVLERDGEIEATIPEAALVRALDQSGPPFRLWRKRTMPEAQRLAAVERLAALRKRGKDGPSGVGRVAPAHGEVRDATRR